MQQPQRRRRRRRRTLGGGQLLLGLAAVLLAVFLVTKTMGGGKTPPAEKLGGDSQQQEPGSEDKSDGIQGEEPVIPNDPGGSQAGALSSGETCSLKDFGQDAIYTGDLVLVNNWTLFHFPADQESDLMCVLDNKTGSYYVKDSTVYLLPQALDALNTMMDAFQAQGGSKSVNVVAGHRTEEFQQHLFDQSAERNGLEHAQKYVAQPGGSEHHTGLVVDFSILHPDGSSEEYQGQGEYGWINEHCQEYGYIVRYEAGKEEQTGIFDEPWHFRYIGVPHATEAAAQGLCLEEYIEYLKGFTFDGEHLTIDCASGRYEVWYEAGSKAHVPESGEYSVSGNNQDGLIVTCKVG